MNNLKNILATLLFLATTAIAFANINVCISNQEVKGDALYFDLFLSTESEGEVAYLSNSDFVFTMDDVDFDDLTFTKVSADGVFDNGFCSFTSAFHTEAGALATLVGVQRTYFDNTQTAIVGDLLIVNVSGLVINDEQDLKTRGARIDHQQATHRLGRFKVEGVSGTNSTIKFSTSNGLKTKMFGHDVLEPNLNTKQLGWKKCNAKKSMVQPSEVNNFELVLFPNPTNSNVQVSVVDAEWETRNYYVYSIDGREMTNGALRKGNANVLDLEGFPNGVYLLKVEGQQEIYKIVKQ